MSLLEVSIDRLDGFLGAKYARFWPVTVHSVTLFRIPTKVRLEVFRNINDFQ